VKLKDHNIAGGFETLQSDPKEQHEHRVEAFINNAITIFRFSTQGFGLYHQTY
jgi:hypothetical protein